MLIQFLCIQRFIGSCYVGFTGIVGARIGSGGWFNCFLCMPWPILSFHTYLYCYFIPTCDPLWQGNMLLGHNLSCKDVFSGSKIVYECYEHWHWKARDWFFFDIQQVHTRYHGNEKRRKVHVIFMLCEGLGAGFMRIMALRVFMLGNKSNNIIQFDISLFWICKATRWGNMIDFFPWSL